MNCIYETEIQSAYYCLCRQAAERSRAYAGLKKIQPEEFGDIHVFGGICEKELENQK